MTYRNANYTAFYVSEPFSPGNLRAFAAPDFNYYMLIKAWKKEDPTFPFINAHDKTYDVRDGSDWERTLKPRLRQRLRCSKNIILILSSHTKASRALTEEIAYGIGVLGLPVIVAYPEFAPVGQDRCFDKRVFGLWESLPVFRRLMDGVPTVHIPMEKEALRVALSQRAYMVQDKCVPGRYA